MIQIMIDLFGISACAVIAFAGGYLLRMSQEIDDKSNDTTNCMRNATPEEIKSVDDYIKSISVDTRIDFFEVLERDEKQ